MCFRRQYLTVNVNVNGKVAKFDATNNFHEVYSNILWGFELYLNISDAVESINSDGLWVELVRTFKGKRPPTCTAENLQLIMQIVHKWKL